MHWQRLRSLFGGKTAGRPAPAPAVALSMSGRSAAQACAAPLAIASLGAAPQTAAERTGDFVQASAAARDFLATRHPQVVLDQAAAFPLKADGTLAETVDSAWHFGFWCESSGPDWPLSYQSVRLEPNGSPDTREHSDFETAPGVGRGLDLSRCLKPADIIRAALRSGMVTRDDALYHVAYFAPSEGQPALARISSHATGRELDHRCLQPENGKIMPPPLKTKKRRPLLSR